MTSAPAISFEGIDHVQLAAPPGCEAEGRRFFGELLGLKELPKPAALAVRGGLWFQCGAQQIHVGIERDFRAAKKAHPAFRLVDEASLEALKARLRAAGVVTKDDREIEDAVRFFADDPWGNRLEFVASRKEGQLVREKRDDASPYREVWEHKDDGRAICALIHGDRGWLMYLTEPGDSGHSSRDPTYDGPPEAVLDFVLANGQRDEYPVAWTLPLPTVQRALDHFRQTGERAPFVTWHAD